MSKHCMRAHLQTHACMLMAIACRYEPHLAWTHARARAAPVCCPLSNPNMQFAAKGAVEGGCKAALDIAGSASDMLQLQSSWSVTTAPDPAAHDAGRATATCDTRKLPSLPTLLPPVQLQLQECQHALASFHVEAVDADAMSEAEEFLHTAAGSCGGQEPFATYYSCSSTCSGSPRTHDSGSPIAAAADGSVCSSALSSSTSGDSPGQQGRGEARGPADGVLMCQESMSCASDGSSSVEGQGRCGSLSPGALDGVVSGDAGLWGSWILDCRGDLNLDLGCRGDLDLHLDCRGDLDLHLIAEGVH